MQRREFLKHSAVLAASTLTAHSRALAIEAEPRASSSKYLPMNRGWRYAPRTVVGSESPSFDDSSFTEVVIPHSTVMLPWHDFDDKAYEFVSTYRRRFRMPEGTQGKRVFVDFEGAMVASTVWINGQRLGEYRGGYTPFSFELTPHLQPHQDNVLVVALDSTERPDIPPFGGEVDYLTFGGIYREVNLRVVPDVYLDNVFARGLDVMGSSPKVEVNCFLGGAPVAEDLALRVELLDGDRVVVASTEHVRTQRGPDPSAALFPEVPGKVEQGTQAATDPHRVPVLLELREKVKLWDLDSPHLYEVRVQLLRHGQVLDLEKRRIGLREAVFTEQGFRLNGKTIKLRGLDRHQMFPYAGQAMPRRVQRRDADILRLQYHCNIVRTSHYPQSRHFLDRCDEIGLLVLEEIPGWQHIGPKEWQDLAVDNVGRMIRRDWNHPSIVLWGVRINESRDNHDFYTRTNAVAHALDTSRQTGGIRNFTGSEFLEDVFTINDFGFPLKAPNHPRYLNTEFVGHTYPTRSTDDNERQREHTLRHVRIHNQLGSDPQYAGGIGWCAFDYNTHSGFGAGDRMCYHGVLDIFREPKPAAGFYKSQVDPEKEVVLEPAFHWARGDEALVFTEAMFCSNCDLLKVFIREVDDEAAAWVPAGEVKPSHDEFPHLQYPPFRFRLSEPNTAHMVVPWGDMKVEGYVKGKLAVTKKLSGSGSSRQFHLDADDTDLLADGADTTRVVMRATDQFGNVRPLAADPIRLRLDGPGTIIGGPDVSLVGGVSAVWIRSGLSPGTLRLVAVHPILGEKTVTITTRKAEPERV